MTDIKLRINRVAFNFGFILVLGYAITRDIFGISDTVGAVLLSVGAMLLVIPFIIVVTTWTPLFMAGTALKLPSNRGSEYITTLVICVYLGLVAIFGDRIELSVSQIGAFGLFLILFCYFALGACIEYDEATSETGVSRASS
jgi:hypothetical protein